MSWNSKSNMSWDQAFRECNESFAKSKKLGEIANELYPIEGEVRDNFIGLTKDQRDEVYKRYVV